LSKKPKKTLEKEEETGVQLFSASKVKLVDVPPEDFSEETAPQSKPKKKKRRLSDGEFVSESDKVKQSAVSVDWVLKKKGDYGQSCRKPGELIQGATHSWDKKPKNK